MKQKMARYEMHKYWGKKPSKHIFELIERYSKVGDIVLDPFAGYGVFVCEAYLNGRNAIGSDLNPAATFIQEQLLSSTNKLEKFEVEIFRILEATKKSEESWYREKCPSCGGEAIVVATLRSKLGGILKNKIRCGCTKTMIEYSISGDSINGLVAKEAEEKLVDHPSSVLIRNGRISALDNMTTDDLFTVRALACHAALFDEINRIEDFDVKNLAKLAFTSNLANCSKLVPPIKSRGAMNPGAWMTGFYIGENFIENNVFHYFKNRVNKIISGKSDFFEMDNICSIPVKSAVESISDFDSLSRGYLIDNQDAKNLNYPDSSIDYIFTDPPYGDTVPYFEQSTIWNTWLQNTVDYENEVVISDSKIRSKDAASFGSDIAICIKEIWRVLKPNKYFSITFHSLSGEEWYALMHSCLKSGFVLHDIELMEQKTFAPRQLNRKMTIKGDLLITLLKPAKLPELKFLDEEKTRLLILGGVGKLLTNGMQSTNDVYVHILKVLFSEHAIFAKTNFIEVLTENFSLDEQGFWSLSNYESGNSKQAVNY